MSNLGRMKGTVVKILGRTSFKRGGQYGNYKRQAEGKKKKEKNS